MDELGILIVGGMSDTSVSLEQLLLIPLKDVVLQLEAAPSTGAMFEAQTVDAAGRTKRDMRLATAAMYSNATESQWLLSGVIPYDDDAVQLRILSERETVYELSLPKPDGTIELPAGWWGDRMINEARDIAWRSSLTSADDRYLVSYSWDDGNTWMAISLMLPVPSCRIDFTTLPGGDQCRLRILGSNGTSAAVFVSERFAVEPKAVLCSIQEPRNGMVVTAGPMLAVGQAYDYQSRRFVTSDLSWTDRIAGGAVSSAVGSGTYSVFDCSVGVHHLTLSDQRSGHSAEVVFEAVPYAADRADVVPDPLRD